MCFFFFGECVCVFPVLFLNFFLFMGSLCFILVCLFCLPICFKREKKKIIELKELGSWKNLGGEIKEGKL